MNIKEKILNEIKKDSKNTLGMFAINDKYLKTLEKMENINTKSKQFKNYPANLLENFDFEIYKIENLEKVEIPIPIEVPSNANIIVGLNGFFGKKSLKLVSKGLNVESIADKIHKNNFDLDNNSRKTTEINENQISIINNLLSKDGIYIEISENTTLTNPIYILNVITDLDKNYFINTQKIIKIGTNSFVDIIEIDLFHSCFDTFYSELFSLEVAENSTTNYSKLYLNTDSSNLNRFYSIKNSEYNIKKDGFLNLNNILLGSSYNTEDASVALKGNNSVAKHSFLGVTINDNIVDVNMTIHHQGNDTNFSQQIKSVASDNSKIYFDGKIIIENEAENTKAVQNSKGILLSNDAKIHFQPQLEIYNDNVTANHGAAIGNLDTDLLFYIKSRGINDNIAKKLLLTAFATDIVNQSCSSDNLKDYAINKITEII